MDGYLTNYCILFLIKEKQQLYWYFLNTKIDRIEDYGQREQSVGTQLKDVTLQRN